MFFRLIAVLLASAVVFSGLAVHAAADDDDDYDYKEKIKFEDV